MDIFTHAMAGTAIGAAASITKSNKIKIILAGTIGSIIPDIDAISLWSKFDTIMKQLFNLDMTGREIYFSKLWYSHRSFFHSIMAAILFSIFIILFQKIKKNPKIEYIIPSCFFAAYMSHLALDMVTPAYLWGGINLIWPMGIYIGGTGQVWWWNNYDIFLILTMSFLLSILSILLIGQMKPLLRRFIPSLIILATTSLIFYQIEKRNYSYDYTKYKTQYKSMEQKSLKEQREILGKNLFELMKKIDKILPFYF